MRLRWQEIDKALLVYREKWDVIAYSCASGLACLGVAVGAYLLSERPDAPRVFLSAFSFFFGLAGTALMLRLIVESRRIVGEPGFHVLSADSLGISITAYLGARTQSFAWTSIDEVMLAARLKTIEPDETTYLGRTIVVFLTSGEYGSWSVSTRMRAAVSLSAEGRPYLCAPFPKGQEIPLEEILRQYAPTRVKVRSEERAIFDFRKNADLYSTA
jgi:hypothetical protein